LQSSRTAAHRRAHWESYGFGGVPPFWQGVFRHNAREYRGSAARHSASGIPSSLRTIFVPRTIATILYCAWRPAPLDRVLVIIIINRGGQKLGQNRAKLDWPLGQSLGGFPHRGVLQIARAEWPDNLQYPRFKLIMQNMLARRRDRSDGRWGQPNLARNQPCASTDNFAS
jgi:hypothetical protein